MYRLKLFSLSILIFLFSGCVEDERPLVKRRMALLPADDFMMTVDTRILSIRSSPATQFTIPTFGEDYNYDVDCNDDGIDEATGITGDYTCDYVSLGGEGIYTLRIKNTFPQIYFDFNGDERKIVTIDQWGSGIWRSFKDAFEGAYDMEVIALDVPNLSGCQTLAGMFRFATFLTGSSGNWNWDTSTIRDMSMMFFNTRFDNSAIGTWDVGAVVDMNRMFTVSSFNQDISNWDVSNVRNMESMFSNNAFFNQDIDRWDVGNVGTMKNMFTTTNFNKNIGSWNVSRVTNMQGMFSRASAFNQDIGLWNTRAVSDMGAVFSNATAFNQNIGAWDTSSVTGMDGMFANASNFNQDISNWDTSNVVGMASMFERAYRFDRPLGKWNVQSLKRGEFMFRDVRLSTHNYDDLLNGWATSQVLRDVFINGGTSQYCLGESARNLFISDKNWFFRDDGKHCTVNVELGGQGSGQEGSGGNLPVLLVRGTLFVTSTVSVELAVAGSAIIGGDFTFSSPQVITIPAGTYDGTLATAIAIPTLSILNDDISEPDETIHLFLSSPSAEVLFGDTNNDGEKLALHIYTIIDDDICTTDLRCQSGICDLSETPAACEAENTCGNSVMEASEFCDDGNTDSGDGCDSNCKLEDDIECSSNEECASGLCDLSTQPGKCELPDTCGNSVLENDEICDDGNIESGDGCSDNCKLGYQVVCATDEECASSLCDTVCKPSNVCGNGVIENNEGCDDANTEPGDGCSADCQIEDANNCVGDRNCPEGQICKSGVCDVECKQDIDCDDGLHCDLGSCVECVQSLDCPEDGGICARGTCTRACSKNEECENGFCQISTQLCVACLENNDCESELCDPLNNTCVDACTTNDDCSPSGFCDPTRGCVECIEHTDCLENESCVFGICDDAQKCDPKLTSCNSPCEENMDCTDSRIPICVGKQCVECGTSVDCIGKELCNAENQCEAPCLEDAVCGQGICGEDRLCKACLDCDGIIVPKDEGCGCASTQPKFPLAFFFLVGFFVLGRARTRK